MGRIVVLDPNIWVSFAWNDDFSLLEKALFANVVLASSQKVLDELERVLRRKKFAKRISEENFQYIVWLHNAVITMLTPTYSFANAPDLNDNYLFDICREASADYLVTGDNELFV